MSKLFILFFALFGSTIAYGGFLSIGSTDKTITGAKTFDPATKTAGANLSNNNLTFTTNPNGTAYSIVGKNSALYAVQWTIVNKIDDNLVFGLSNKPVTGGGPGIGNDGVGCFADGSCYNNSLSTQANLGTFVNGDVGTMAANLNTKLVWFRRNNGPWNGNANANPDLGIGGFPFSSLMTGMVYFTAFATSNGASLTVNVASANTGLTDFAGW